MEQISPRQFTILATLFTIGTSLLVLPSQLATDVKQDAWIAAIYCGCLNLVYVLLYIVLFNRYPGLSLIQIVEKILGKWLGKIISWLYILFFMILTTLLLNFLGEFVNTLILLMTPPWFIYMSFLAVVVIGLSYGIESISRAAELFFPIVLIFLLIMIVSLFKDMDVSNIQPINEFGFMVDFSSGLKMSTFQEHICLLMLLSFIAKKEKQASARSLFIGVLIGSIILILFTLFTILVLGNYNTGLSLYPVFIVVQTISIGDFFQRIEILMIAVWFLAVFVKICVTFFAALTGITQTMNIKSYKKILLPLAVLVAVYAKIVYPNTAAFLQFAAKSWLSFGLLYMFVIPLMLLIIDWIKKGLSNRNHYNELSAEDDA